MSRSAARSTSRAPVSGGIQRRPFARAGATPQASFAIRLVTKHEYISSFLRVVLSFGHPHPVNIVKGGLVSHIIDDDNSIGSAIVTAGDSSETFLACSVPDLELNVLAINFDGLESANSSHPYRKSTPMVVK